MKGDFGNIVGPQIRRLRYQRGWSQAKLAVRLQLAGFDISRESLAKVESQIHQVEDYQLLYYARALGVAFDQLFPPLPPGKPIHDVIVQLRSRSKQTASQRPGVAKNPVLAREAMRDGINGQPRMGKGSELVQQKKQIALTGI